MKAVINCRTPLSSWQNEYFPEIAEYMLPIVGKPLIEFYVDWCSLSGINDILFVFEDFDEDTINFLSDGSRWGVNISAVTAPPDADRKAVELHNSKFINGEPYFYLDGYFFPLYDKNSEKISAAQLDCPKIRFIKNGAEECADFPVLPCKCIGFGTLGEYFDLNMDMLKNHSAGLIMKGYGADTGVFIGMNDIIPAKAALVPPFVIGDNSQLEEFVQIGPCAIIGDTCIIDKNTKLDETLIFDKTYIGCDLDLKRKIFYANKIIDPVSGVQLAFNDNSFSSKVSTGLAKRVFSYALSLPFICAFTVLLAPLYFAYSFFSKPKFKTVSVPTHNGSTRMPVYETTRENPNTWFFKLSLDKFFPLLLALRCSLKLIGDTPRDAEAEADILSRYKKYAAGVFTYSDSLGHENNYETLIDDIFYSHNRTLKTDMQLILRSFVGRLFKGDKPE